MVKIVLLLLLLITNAFADELITIDDSNYVLSGTNKPQYTFILFPGGTGKMDPHLDESNQIQYAFKGNFLIRSKALWTRNDKINVVMGNSTSSVEKIDKLVDYIQHQFSGTKIYLVTTSRSTIDGASLYESMNNKLYGMVFTASFSNVERVDPAKTSLKLLLVHHIDDSCRHTPFSVSSDHHRRYGTALISIDGGTGDGNPCEAQSQHGFKGVEQETVDKIVAWIEAH
jgi:hypothetical protein